MHGGFARGLLLCLACLGIVTSEAQATPGWTPVRPIGYGNALDFRTLVADLTPTGAATVTWRGTTEGHAAILAVAGATSGGFTPSVVVSRGTSDVGRPSLAVSPSGAAVATWAQKDADGMWVVQASVRTGGTWSAPEQLSRPTVDPPDPSTAIADNGNAIVVWVGEGFLGEGVQASRREGGSGWTAPEYVHAYPGGDPHVVMDAEGNATVLWLRRPSKTDPPSIVSAAERPAGGTWSSLHEFGGGSGPHLAVGADGTVAAIWNAAPYATAAIRPRGGSWSSEDTGMWSGSYPGERPQIAVDGAGNVTAIGGSSANGIQYTQRPAGGTWPLIRTYLRTPYWTDNYWPAIAANSRGIGVISYLGVKDAIPTGGGGTPIVHASMGKVGGAWTDPFGIANPGGVVGLDIDEADDVLVCWPTHTGAAYCRVYDATAPRLLDLSVPDGGVAERALAFGVRPVDSWSALGTTTWSFGDGTSATGTRPAHTYAAAGRYTVRVTARDALGNATSAQRIVNVAPAPPKVVIDEARFRKSEFRRSELSDKARLLVAGTLSAPLRVSFRLTGPFRPKADRRTVVLATRDLGAGAFAERVRVPGAVVEKMLPGRYELEITGPGLIPDVARVLLRPPKQGVVMAHRISTSRTGPNLLRVTAAKRLWATFTFAPGAATDQKLRAAWYAPNHDQPVGSFPVKRAFSWWANPSGLAKGRWRCVLLARGKVVDSVSIRVG